MRANLTGATPRWGGEFLESGTATASRVNDSGDVTLVLHGEVYGTSYNDPAARLLARYLDEGTDFVRSLRGSFAIVILDARRDAVYVVTDWIGSRAVYWTRHVDGMWVATAHAFPLLSSFDDDLDRTGVAQYLVNGIPLTPRTLFSGVRALRAGAVHELTEQGWKTRPYWVYRFDATEEDSERLGEELAELLQGAVKRSVGDDPDVFLSLSGGYDSATILGLLHRAGVETARCLSYAASDRLDRGDAEVAARMARLVGYPHTVLPAYGASLEEVLGDNLRYGRGLTRLIVETDAWREIGEHLGSHPNAVFLAGDECLGWRDRNLQDAGDVLRVLGIRGWDGLRWLENWFPIEIVREWKTLIRTDLEELLARAPATPDLHDLKDHLYLRVRLPRLLAWRENFAGSYAPVRLPLLDIDILRFMQKVPSDLRRGKKLFRRTVTRLLPEIFAIQRADDAVWMAGRWAREQVDAEAGAVRRLLSEESPLDPLVPPTSLRMLLGDCRNPVSVYRIRRLGLRAVRKIHARLRTTNTPWDRTLGGLLPPVPEPALLLRGLLLRVLTRNLS